MPLSNGKEAYINAIYTILGGEKIKGDDPKLVKEAQAEVLSMAKKLADATEAFIKTGTVTISSGIPVATAGSATNQVGQTTSQGIGSIS